MTAEITLIGMYNYDNSLFAGLVFPAGIDRDLAIQRILNKSEEFEVMYEDFDYLKERIEIWAKIWEHTFKKWVDDLALEYDPLYNYDRHEIYKDIHSRDYTDASKSNSNSSTSTGSSASSTTEQTVSASDSSVYQPDQKETSSASSSQNGTGKADSNTTANGNSNEVITHDAHLFGNIGVTTSVQMLTEDLKIAEWNLYEHISDIFIDEFCILVY